MLIQTFCRFILEQIYQELATPGVLSDGDKLLQRLLSLHLLSISTCQEQQHRQEREIFPFVIDMTYPRKVQDANKNSNERFVNLLKKSINRETITKAWCPQCNQYHMTSQCKKIIEAPNYMFINANLSSKSDSSFWIGDGIWNLLGSTKTTWLPSRIAMILGSEIFEIIDLDKEELDHSKYPLDAAIEIYDLRASIVEVKINKGPGHLAAHINVSESAETPSWYFFNDFAVLPIANEERVFQHWKVWVY